MNMPSAMASKAYDDIVKTLSDSCEKIAEKLMNDAATEIHDLSKSSDSVVDTNISLDGSWQKRGYSSLNGYVAALSMESGKVLDIEVMSWFCNHVMLIKILKKLILYHLRLSKHIIIAALQIINVQLQTWRLLEQKEYLLPYFGLCYRTNPQRYLIWPFQ